MILLLLEAISLYAVSFACWRIIRRFVFKTPLDNVPGPQAHSFLKGNLLQVFNGDGWAFHKRISEQYGSVVKIKGMLGENQLYVSDPKALHHIVVKDQYIYEEPSFFIDGNNMMFGAGLLATLGDHHRKQRKMLNPVFSIAHMRQMTPIFWDIAHKVEAAFAKKTKDGAQEIDMTQWMTRTALELIGQAGLGYSLDPLTEDCVPHPYVVAVKQLIPLIFRLTFVRTYFLSAATKIGSPRFQRWIVNIVPWKTVHELRDVIDVLHNTSTEIFESKKRALEEGDEALSNQVAQGKDIMSILLRENMNASKEDRLSESELIGQMSTLTFAATDTTSGALSRILFLLSTHPDVQQKLRQEIIDARDDGQDLSYDILVNLPYLDAICRETLRLYPPVSQLVRTTRQDVVLPLSKPIKGLDGRDIEEIPIPNNTNVIISLINANRNPEIWGSDSYEWKPERWLQDLPSSVSNAHIPGIYSNLMTFLGGGRACIGFKFSQLEMKVVLSTLVEKFQFDPTDKEICWKMTNIVTPTIVGGDGRPSLPLKVSLISA
ncbi:cytochrome P450 [Crucibulum laeve]|uniref:Cytochrome P450 n=1 Tax=Crucibulum laeve TaxID=68775 RepID=A0A5C3M0N1_9AGAR|nr:cytochrome P450 [Crucibulum laeve]